jgi:crossover junction endodeoxyribonuclease RuvC
LKVMGVDPGSLVTGWGLVGGSSSRPVLIDSGRIRLPSSLCLAERMALLLRELGALVDRLEPDCAAVETPFHGASARSALQLAHARGVILAVLSTRGLPVSEYTPATVKKSITGNGRADKRQVEAMMVHLLGPQARGVSYDVPDALAVAVCHLAASSFVAAVEKASRDASAKSGRG